MVLLDEDRIPLIVRDCAKLSRNDGEGGKEEAREPALHNALSTATMAAESRASRKNRLMSKDSSRPCFERDQRRRERGPEETEGEEQGGLEN